MKTSLMGTMAALALTLGLCGGVGGARAQTFITNFAASTDWDSNFVFVAGTNATTYDAANHNISHNSGTSQSDMFDTSATGGSGGSGGTSGTHADNAYTNVAVSVNFEMAIAGPSIGIWSHVSNNSGSGYLALLNFVSSTSVQLRLYDNDSSPTGSLGTLLVNQTISVPTLSASTYYQLDLLTTDVGSTVNFTLTLMDAAGTTSLATITGSDSTSAALSGQVGLRLGSQSLLIDQFSVSPVPEPGLLTLLGIGGGLLLACGVRYKGAAPA